MTGGALAELERAVRDEARRAPFDVCAETYEQAGRDPTEPILCAGNPEAAVVFVGRELGRDEVLLGEPLVGASGRRLRRVVHETLIGPADPGERRFAAVLDHVLLTNTVPYRPVGNRAYDRATLARFRPFVETLLARHWSGTRVVALGRKALLWFAPYADEGAVKDLWADREARFAGRLDVVVGGRAMKLACVPHPSPLSPFRTEFPALLRDALRDV